MSRFSSLGKGALQGEVIEFPFATKTDRVRIVPLLGMRDADIAQRARLFAIGRGAKAEDSDKEYNLGISVHTIVLACIDPDAPLDKLVPYFESVDEILDPIDGLDRDRIALLCEYQQRIQAEYAPLPRTLSSTDFNDMLDRTIRAEEGAELPFERLPRVTQRLFVRGLAWTVRDLLSLRSTDGPSYPGTEMTSGSAAKPSTESASEGPSSS